MGGTDKGLLELRGRPLAAYALDALAQAAGPLLVSANRNPERYAQFGHPVIADPNDTFDGPLAGLLSAMQAAGTDYLLTTPCDSPFITAALFDRLCATLAAKHASVCAAHDGQRIQPMFLLAECRLAPSLEHYLASGLRQVEGWLNAQAMALADCQDHPEWFMNLNTPEELAEAERAMAEETPAQP